MTECDCGDCDVCAAYWEDTFPDDDRTSDPHSPNLEEDVCSDCGEDCDGYCTEREERLDKEEAEEMQKRFDKAGEQADKIFGEDAKL